MFIGCIRSKFAQKERGRGHTDSRAIKADENGSSRCERIRKMFVEKGGHTGKERTNNKRPQFGTRAAIILFRERREILWKLEEFFHENTPN